MLQSRDITGLQEQLHTYRFNLEYLLRKVSLSGGEVLAPLEVVHMIRLQRHEIDEIKARLRSMGVVVNDDPDDEASPAWPRTLATPVSAPPPAAPLLSSNPVPDRLPHNSTHPPLPLLIRFISADTFTQICWESPLGHTTSLFHSPYPGDKLELVLRALEAARTPGHPDRGPQFTPAERGWLEQAQLWEGDRLSIDLQRRVGRALYAALTADPQALRLLYAARQHAVACDKPLAYVLRFPPQALELATLPWELLWDEQGPLLLCQRRLASCVRYFDLGLAPPPRQIAQRKLHILVLAPRAGMAPHVRAQSQHSRTVALQHLEQHGLALVEQLAVTTPAGLVDRLQSWPPVDILHFVGHGRYEAGQGALLFDDETTGEVWLPAESLAILLGETQLVLLEACQSGMLGANGKWNGVAAALASAGTLAVIAMQLSINAAMAARFSAVVYTRLAHGESIQRAVDQGRQALYAEEQAGLSWFVPTLTLRAVDAEPLYLTRT